MFPSSIDCKKLEVTHASTAKVHLLVKCYDNYMYLVDANAVGNADGRNRQT